MDARSTWWEPKTGLTDEVSWKKLSSLLAKAETSLQWEVYRAARSFAADARTIAKAADCRDAEAVACGLIAVACFADEEPADAVEPLEFLEHHLLWSGRLEDLRPVQTQLELARMWAEAENMELTPKLQEATLRLHVGDVDKALALATEARSEVRGFKVAMAMAVEAQCLIELDRWDEAVLLVGVAQELLFPPGPYEELRDQLSEIRSYAFDRRLEHRLAKMEEERELAEEREAMKEEARRLVKEAKDALEADKIEEGWRMFARAWHAADASMDVQCKVSVRFDRSIARLQALDAEGARQDIESITSIVPGACPDWQPVVTQVVQMVDRLDKILKDDSQKSPAKDFG